MHVLMISGDPSILKGGSVAHARLLLQRSQVDQLAAYVWPQVHSARTILRAAHAQSFDVVTVQDPFWRGLLGWWIARRTRVKLNVQVHTDLTAQPWWRRTLAYFVLRRADSIRVVSEKIQRDLSFLHLRASIMVLPIFVDLAPFKAIIHTPHPHFKKTILWIGRFEPEKDPAAALRILAEVRDTGIDAGLILLGAGSLERDLRAKAKPLLPYVEFPGWQDPAPYLAMADVVVSTSRHESYGASMLEALAAGVPVVAPDMGVAQEAGAVVVSREDCAAAVTRILQSGERGALKLSLRTAEEWGEMWRKSLGVY